MEGSIRLFNEILPVVRESGKTAGEYAKALRQTEEACRLNPQSSQLLHCHGVAQYRLGQYPEALATLSRSKELNVNNVWGDQGDLPGGHAFLAMTNHQLGQNEDAGSNLARLRKTMEKPGGANANDEALLREAEALIEGKAVQPVN